MRTFFIAALLLALAPACTLEVVDPHERLPRPRPPRNQPGEWGDACRIDRPCASGLACTSGRCEPKRIGIYPVNALIAPGKADGWEWDADRALPRWVWNELDQALYRDVDALYAFMDEQRRKGWSMPDPYGYGFLSVDGRRYDPAYTITLAERGQGELDVFDPSWSGSVGWSRVPFTEDLAVAFELWDEDRRDDDLIGFVELDFSALRTALYQGGLVHFDTYEVTDGQLLLLGLRVVAER